MFFCHNHLFNPICVVFTYRTQLKMVFTLLFFPALLCQCFVAASGYFPLAVDETTVVQSKQNENIILSYKKVYA